MDAEVIKNQIESETLDMHLSDVVVCEQIGNRFPSMSKTYTVNKFLGISEMEDVELKIIHRSQVCSEFL